MHRPTTFIESGPLDSQFASNFIEWAREQSFPILSHQRFGIASDAETLEHSTDRGRAGILEGNLEKA